MEILTQTLLPDSTQIGQFLIKKWVNNNGKMCAGVIKILSSGPNKGMEVPVRGSQYSFADEGRRNGWMTKQIAFYQERIDVKNVSRQKALELASEEHPFVEGTLLYTSWGYEQTNVDFYQVISRTAGTITVREIKAETVPGTAGDMSGMVRPVKDSFIGEPFKMQVRAKSYRGKDAEWHICYKHYPSVYDGGEKGKYTSSYA